MNSFFKISIILAVISLFLSCRAHIINGDQISSDKSYILYGKEKKYTKQEIKLLGADSQDYKIRNDLAVFLIKSGRIENGTWILHTIVEQSIKDHIPYLNLAKVFSTAQDNEKLLETYSKMLKSGAMNETEAENLAKKLYLEKKDSESYYLINSLYNSSEKNKMNYAFWLANFHLEKAEFGNALNYFLNIISINKTNSKALFNAGYIYSMGQDHIRAVEYLQLAEKYGYRDSLLPYYLAKSYFGLGKFNDALRTLETVPNSMRDFKITVLQGEILLAKNYSTDLSFLLTNKKEIEKIKLINHWYGSVFDESDDEYEKNAEKNGKTIYKVRSGYVMNVLKKSKNEFLQLY